MQEWVVSAMASGGAATANPAHVRRYLEGRGALSVFAAVVGSGVLRVAFRWPASCREAAEDEGTRLVEDAVGEHDGQRVRAVAR